MSAQFLTHGAGGVVLLGENEPSKSLGVVPLHAPARRVSDADITKRLVHAADGRGAQVGCGARVVLRDAVACGKQHPEAKRGIGLARARGLLQEFQAALPVLFHLATAKE